ncbi:MAG: hypothetical protein ABL962_04215 [Fimbriimonadaceae bacterium]
MPQKPENQMIIPAATTAEKLASFAAIIALGAVRAANSVNSQKSVEPDVNDKHVVSETSDNANKNDVYLRTETAQSTLFGETQ